MAKWVYSFGNGKAEGRADMRNLLGGKGANLAEMSSLGLPVPPGFTITAQTCIACVATTLAMQVRATSASASPARCCTRQASS